MNELKPEEWIKRYVYDVTRRLPVSQREDISRELESLIGDMMEERAGNGKSEQETVEEVLRELGSPALLAGKYREDKKYLIGPEYFEQYWFVLKLVLIAVAFGMVVASIVQGAAWAAALPAATDPARMAGDIAAGVGGAAANTVMGLIQGFAWVTIIFAVIERCSLKAEGIGNPSAAWTPQSLRDQPVPSERALIKKGECIAGIVFTVAVVILFNFFPGLMSFYLWDNGVLHTIPLFDPEGLRAALPLLNLCLALGIVREVMRVAVGRHTVLLGIAAVVLNVAALIAACAVFFNSAVWNPGLIDQAAALNADFASAAAQLNVFWDYFTRFFGFLLIFAYVLDSAVSLYKGIRYGRRRTA